MKIVADVNGQNTPIVKSFNIYSAAGDMYKGDLVEAGTDTAAGIGNGVIIPVATAAAPADVAGLLTQLHDYSVDGDFTIAGAASTRDDDSQNNMVDVDIRPGAIYRSEVKESTNTFTTTAASDTCTIGTAAGADDLYAGSFVYDENGELHSVEDHSATTTLVFHSVTVTAQAGVASTCIWIPQRLVGKTANHGLTYTKGTSTVPDSSVLLKGDESTLWFLTLDCFYAEAGKQLMRLLPKDDMKTLTSPKFYIDFIIRDHLLNPLS